MDFLDRVRRGDFGVRYAVPDHLERGSIESLSAMLFDVPGQLGWHLGTYDLQLDLRLEHQQLLERDIERHTRDLFENYSRHRPRPAGAKPPERIRTDDPTWSPVVSIERVSLAGTDALTVIHRMAYEPGHESVMGHLLVPTRQGLFEFRPISNASVTGMRETVLLDHAMRASPDEDPEALMRRLGNKHYDDPAHDTRFPDHPLTRVRAALRRVLNDASLVVTQPAESTAPGEISLPLLACAITPPPRYLPIANAAPGSPVARFARVSFAGTDGVEHLTVLRDQIARMTLTRRASEFMEYARRTARDAIAPGARNVNIDVQLLDADGPLGHARGWSTFEDATGERNNAWRWLADERGCVTMFAIATPRCVPRDEMLAEVDATAESWRPIASPSTDIDEEKPTRKWWQWW